MRENGQDKPLGSVNESVVGITFNPVAVFKGIYSFFVRRRQQGIREEVAEGIAEAEKLRYSNPTDLRDVK